MSSIENKHKRFDWIVQHILHINILKNISNDDETAWLLSQNIENNSAVLYNNIITITMLKLFQSFNIAGTKETYKKCFGQTGVTKLKK